MQDWFEKKKKKKGLINLGNEEMQSGVLQQLLIYTLNSNHRGAKEEYKGILTSMNSEAMGFL